MFCVSSALRLIHFPTGHLLIHRPLTRPSNDQIERFAAKRHSGKLPQLPKVGPRRDHRDKRLRSSDGVPVHVSWSVWILILLLMPRV